MTALKDRKPEKENLKSIGKKKPTQKQNTKSQALLVARSSESLSDKGKPKSRHSRVHWKKTAMTKELILNGIF